MPRAAECVELAFATGWLTMLCDRLELPPDISGVQGSARPGGEDQITVGPRQAGGGPVVGLPLPVSPQRGHRHLGQVAEGRPE